VTLTDILGKTGQQGGIEAISQLFGGHGLQGILSAMQSNGMGQQAKSWIASGPNVPVTGADIKKVANPSALARMARQTMAAIEWRKLARHDRQQWGTRFKARQRRHASRGHDCL